MLYYHFSRSVRRGVTINDIILYIYRYIVARKTDRDECDLYIIIVRVLCIVLHKIRYLTTVVLTCVRKPKKTKTDRVPTYCARGGRDEKNSRANASVYVLAAAERLTATSRMRLPRVAVVGNARPVTGWAGGGGDRSGGRDSGSEVRLRPSTPRVPRAQRVAGISSSTGRRFPPKAVRFINYYYNNPASILL